MCESILERTLKIYLKEEKELYEHYENIRKHRKFARELEIPIWFDGYFLEY